MTWGGRDAALAGSELAVWWFSSPMAPHNSGDDILLARKEFSFEKDVQKRTCLSIEVDICDRTSLKLQEHDFLISMRPSRTTTSEKNEGSSPLVQSSGRNCHAIGEKFTKNTTS